MKKIITIIAVVILITSCSSENNEVIQPTEFGVFLKNKSNSDMKINYLVSNNISNSSSPIKTGELIISDENILTFSNQSDIDNSYIKIELLNGNYSDLEVYYFSKNGDFYFDYIADDNLLAKSILEINLPHRIQNETYIDFGFSLELINSSGNWLDSNTWKPL